MLVKSLPLSSMNSEIDKSQNKLKLEKLLEQSRYRAPAYCIYPPDDASDRNAQTAKAPLLRAQSAIVKPALDPRSLIKEKGAES